MRLEFSPLAEADIEAIGDYIAQDSPRNASRFIDGLRVQCQKITLAPMAYVARPELGDGVRSCAHKRYVIFFRSETEYIRIERVLHSAREIHAGLEVDGDPLDG